MQLKRSYILLIIGVSLLVIGSIVLNLISADLEKRYGEVVIIIPNKQIDSKSSFTVDFELLKDTGNTLAIASRTPNSFLSAKLVNQDNQILDESAFNDKLLIPLKEFKIDTYKLTLTNFDDKTVTVNAIIAPEPTLEQIEEFLDLAYNSLVGASLVFSGLIICFVGIIIWVIDRRK